MIFEVYIPKNGYFSLWLTHFGWKFDALLIAPMAWDFYSKLMSWSLYVLGQFGKFHQIFSPNKLALFSQLRELKIFKISSMRCGNMEFRPTTKLSWNVQYHVKLRPVKFHANIWHSLATMPKKTKFSLFSSSENFVVAISHTYQRRKSLKFYQDMQIGFFWMHAKFGEDSSGGLVARSMHTKSNAFIYPNFE